MKVVLGRSLLIVSLLAPCALARADDTSDRAADASLFRIFLKDGTALASYGEFARVGERVIFSLPLGQGRQHLASIAVAEVDWARTDGYAYAVRAANYASTRGDAEYAEMSGRIARTLTEIATGRDPGEQLRRAEQARGELAEWPGRHFGYKADEIRDTLGVLDEVIAGLRAKTNGPPSGRFDLALVAGAATPPRVPLLAAPSLKDSIEQALRLATLAESSAERVELLRSAAAALDAEAATLVVVDGGRVSVGAGAGRAAASGDAAEAAGAGVGAGRGAGSDAGVDSAGGSGGGAGVKSGAAGGAVVLAGRGAGADARAGAESWIAAARTTIARTINLEAELDRAYASLTTRVLATAERRVKNADVRGLTKLRAQVDAQDARLGRKRPDQLSALLATVDTRLDAAQRLRLARDRWASKAGAYRTYQRAIAGAVDQLRRAQPSLNDIRALAGPSADALLELGRRLDRLTPGLRTVFVPADLRSAHASLVSAWQLTDAAVRQRQRAVADNDMTLARNASAAAAGALMLFEHVQTEIARLIEMPSFTSPTSPSSGAPMTRLP